MSRDFRPVVETWGPNSSCFVESDAIVEVLTSLVLASSPDLTSSPDGQVSVNGYGEVDVLWIENGKKFLDYVDSKTVDQMISENSEITERPDVEDVRSLIGNIKALSSDWRKLVDPKGGALRFYIDQY